MQLIENLKKSLLEKAVLHSTPPDQKRTGLAEISSDSLLTLFDQHGAFPQNRCSVLRTANWNRLLGEEMLNSAILKEYKTHLKQALRGKPLIELGVGDNYVAHRKIFTEQFLVSEYLAVDSRATNHDAVTRGDLLRF